MSDQENINSSLEETVGRLITIVQSIDSRLVDLEAKVDSRLYDTRPNFEALKSQLSEVIESQGKFQEQMNGVQNDLQDLRDGMSGVQDQVQNIRNDLSSLRAETEKGFRTIDRRMERQIGEFEKLHAYQRDLEDRVDEIEKRLNS